MPGATTFSTKSHGAQLLSPASVHASRPTSFTMRTLAHSLSQSPCGAGTHSTSATRPSASRWRRLTWPRASARLLRKQSSRRSSSTLAPSRTCPAKRRTSTDKCRASPGCTCARRASRCKRTARARRRRRRQRLPRVVMPAVGWTRRSRARRRRRATLGQRHTTSGARVRSAQFHTCTQWGFKDCFKSGCFRSPWS